MLPLQLPRSLPEQQLRQNLHAGLLQQLAAPAAPLGHLTWTAAREILCQAMRFQAQLQRGVWSRRT